jgi:D-alanyl-D-alanine carboxypeptidase/D-alanyl-D-alanine-endopeptidase (penicillin-binding protein 4)
MLPAATARMAANPPFVPLEQTVKRPRVPLPVLWSSFFAAITALSVASSPVHGAAGDAVSQALRLPNASLVVEERGRPALSYQPDRPMVPASTMKILTSLAAIDRWGMDHRFHTDFYRSADGWLWVKGHGDPYLVSEELDRVAKALKSRGVGPFAGIGTDDSLFAPSVEIAGRSDSDNPYDAPVTALAVNFNTVSLVRIGKGVRSAEPQTPLTPLARRLGARLPAGEQRINLKERALALRYFAEVLGAKLTEADIAVGEGVRNGPVPPGSRLVYRHENSRTLRAVLASMLKYSNNFIANDLFLLLGGKGDGRAIRSEDAQRAAAAWVGKTFAWRGYRIEDGAGLSRGNRLSARQLLEAVKAFAPYRDLLPEHTDSVRAKTGTLTGVSCYAGFVERKGRWEPFSLMINQPVGYDFRLRVASELANAPDVGRLCPKGSC